MRFLLCVDGSPDSCRAIDHLKRIVKEKDEVFLLHAWKPLDSPPTIQMVVVSRSFFPRTKLFKKQTQHS